MVPYSGRLGARIEHLEPGRSEVALRDRRRVRNHLGSVHAVALTNLGELATGLAVLTAVPPGVRGIVTRLDTTYHRKARGRLTASACWQAPSTLTLPTEVRALAAIVDASGETVATLAATWQLGATR
jgi:acyl-coenzyme A thioesterase PaaI-like protein